MTSLSAALIFLFDFQQVAQQKLRNEDAGQLTELVRDFLDPGEFYQAIRNIGIDFFCGVPDSLLKGKSSFLKKGFATPFFKGGSDI